MNKHDGVSCIISANLVMSKVLAGYIHPSGVEKGELCSTGLRYTYPAKSWLLPRLTSNQMTTATIYVRPKKKGV